MDLLLLQIETGAIIQGVVAAVVVLGAAIVYFDRISSLSSSLERLTNSVEAIEEDVAAVELTQMERTLTKLDYAMDQTQEDSGFPSGEGTVYHELDKTGRKVGVSYVTTHPDKQAAEIPEETEIAQENFEGRLTEIKTEFEDEVNMQALHDRIINNDEMAKIERKIVGFEVTMRINSPFEFTIKIPSTDGELIGEFVNEYLSKIDAILYDIETTTENVESEIEKSLKSE